MLTSTEGKFTHEFTRSGVYRPLLTVTDSEGVYTTAEIAVIAGNALPEIEIAVKGNETYYFPKTTAAYAISVADAEDGSTGDGRISASAVSASVNFLEEGYDQTAVAQGHQKPSHPGQLLIAESDCKSCHLTDQRSAGPAYLDIARKYKGETGALEKLASKIIKGGSGVWGDVAMAAHPQIKQEDAIQMVTYILSLAGEAEKKNTMGLTGNLRFDQVSVKPFNTKSAYMVQATYTDKGSNGLPALTATATKVLRAPYLTAGDPLDTDTRIESLPGAGKAFTNVRDGNKITFRQADLRTVTGLNLQIVEVQSMKHTGGSVEVRLGGVNGRLLGKADLASAPGIPVQAGVLLKSASVSFPALAEPSDLTLVFRGRTGRPDDVLFIFTYAGLLRK